MRERRKKGKETRERKGLEGTGVDEREETLKEKLVMRNVGVLEDCLGTLWRRRKTKKEKKSNWLRDSLLIFFKRV